MKEYASHIQKLRNEIYIIRKRLQTLQAELLTTINCYQEECGKQGHEYVAEENGDYHNPGYYFTCKRCEHFTSRRPL